MVMFRADLPYRVALERGRIQQEILDALVPAEGSSADEGMRDPARADRLILDRLPPLDA
jgi:hypothetical protein